MNKLFKSTLNFLFIAVLTASTAAMAAKPPAEEEVPASLAGPFFVTGDVVTEAGTIVYGDEVGFQPRNVFLKNTARSYVTLICIQDGVAVYHASSWGNDIEIFPLESRGIEWDGGPADCTAYLIKNEKKGKGSVITVLDSIDFHVN